jgi:poly[ADP-ribose] polymerase 16
MESSTTAELLSITIRNHLSQDRLAAELKWFWFRAALFSYKRNFLVRPFPPMFRKTTALAIGSSISALDDDENKDFEKLTSVASTIPALSNLSNEDNGSLENLSLDQMRLLVWVFDTDKNFRLGADEKQTYEQIKKLTGQQYTAKVPEPDYVFRVDYDDEAETKFQRRRGDRKTMFAYHGSRLPNFYSIMKNGLRSNLNQVSAFGEGTYLSPELSVSLNWSPMSSLSSPFQRSTANADAISLDDGIRLSCVAVCEVIDDPTGGGVSRCECALDTNASRTNLENNASNNTNNNGGRRGGGATNNGVPDRYILVKNDDLLRIRYILAYVDRSNVKKVGDGGRTIRDRVTDFCNQYRFWLIMLTYMILLSVIGLVNSNNFQWYVRRFWSASNDEYGYFENFHHAYEES